MSREERWSKDPPDGYPATILDPNQMRTDPNRKVIGRQDPRFFRAAVRVSF